MKSTKQNSDRENDGNISAEELAYLQKKLRRYMTEELFGFSHELNHARDFSATQRADENSLAAVSGRIADRIREMSARQQADKNSLAAVSGRIVDHIREMSATQRADKNSLAAVSDRIADRIREMSATQQADKNSLAAVSGRIADRITEISAAHLIASKPNKTTVLASGFTSLNLNPETSLTTLLENIDYPASGADALNKDWQNVGNDLWKSWAAIKDEHE